MVRCIQPLNVHIYNSSGANANHSMEFTSDRQSVPTRKRSESLVHVAQSANKTSHQRYRGAAHSQPKSIQHKSAKLSTRQTSHEPPSPHKLNTSQPRRNVHSAKSRLKEKQKYFRNNSARRENTFDWLLLAHIPLKTRLRRYGGQYGGCMMCI